MSAKRNRAGFKREKKKTNPGALKNKRKLENETTRKQQ